MANDIKVRIQKREQKARERGRAKSEAPPLVDGGSDDDEADDEAAEEEEAAPLTPEERRQLTPAQPL